MITSRRDDSVCEENGDQTSITSLQNVPPIPDATKKRTPLPKLQIAVVVLIMFSEPVTALVIYPFVNQFIRETGITKGDDEKTGYYAGIIESVFFLAEAATVFQWGWLSDKIGRRPVLLLGPLGLTFAVLGFGYSTTFWPLVLSRSLQGAFNGNIGVSRTVMAELTDETNVGDAFALIPVEWTTATIIAPIIGGVLSNPAKKWPNTFGKVGLFRNHPYFLPCLVAASIAFLGFVTAFLGLKETLQRPSAARSDGYKALDREGDTDALLENSDGVSYGTATIANSRSPSLTPSAASADARQKCAEGILEPPSLRSVLKSRTLQLIVINYLFFVFTDMSYAVLMPLVYSTPIESGGLGLDPNSIGLILGAWGILDALAQFSLLGWLMRRYSATRLYRASYISFLICFLAYPISIFFARRNGGVGVGTSITMFIQLTFVVVVNMAYGAIYVMIAEATPKPVLGSVNGLVQMLGSMTRSVAPSVASSLFSLSLQKHLLGGNFVFAILIGVIIIGIRVSLWLPVDIRTSRD